MEARLKTIKRPGHDSGVHFEAVFWAYFVAGVVAVVASVFVVSLFAAPLFFVVFLRDFSRLLSGWGSGRGLVEDFSVGARAGFVVVYASVFVWFSLRPRKQRPETGRRQQRAERVFFIFFSIPLFLWPAWGLPTREFSATRLPVALLTLAPKV